MKKKLIHEFIETANLCADHSLALCSSGNLSYRTSKNEMMITCAGSWMSELSPEEIVTFDIKRGKIIYGKFKPSSETNLHRMIYMINDKNKAVLHFQSEFATAIACNKKNSSINFNIIPEIPFYIGEVGFVPSFKPGSIELAEAVAEQSKDHRAIIMQNHGIVALGNGLKHVLQIGVFFELCCKIILTNGDNLSTIPPLITAYIKAQSFFV